MSPLTRLILVGVVLIAGCAPNDIAKGGHVDSSAKTMTKAQALARVEQLVKEAAVVVTPNPKLEIYEPSLVDDLCLDPIDGGSQERIVINRSYYIRGIPKDQIKQIASRVKAYWEQQGHFIEAVSPDGANVYGRSRPDDFYITLSWTDGDVPMLGSTSPCIWPNGTPEPSRSGN
ncbi:hypothetical protein [Acrocarpospora catenulata]|uniref:hypothetical protein n=1 Tax=Acrocarpospora catenulata TaxID=2836182 RepID=UPI0020239964|nr:hypothetical protein [Acrocarpospora catenulata]